MRGLLILRAGMLAGASLGVLAVTACATGPAPGPGYTICDDTAANVTCPDDTAPVVVNNSL